MKRIKNFKLFVTATDTIVSKSAYLLTDEDFTTYVTNPSLFENVKLVLAYHKTYYNRGWNLYEHSTGRSLQVLNKIGKPNVVLSELLKEAENHANSMMKLKSISIEEYWSVIDTFELININ